MFANVDDFLRETGAELKIGLTKLYFDDNEWVVATAKSVGSNYKIQDRFLDIPSGLEEALRFFHSIACPLDRE